MNKIKTFKKFNSEDIFRYIRNGDIESVKNYIKFGYDLNIQSNDAYTPLSYAVVFKKIEIVKLLLEYGADVNKQDNDGNTALISASIDNNREIVELLLDYCADEFILNYENQ